MAPGGVAALQDGQVEAACRDPAFEDFPVWLRLPPPSFRRLFRDNVKAAYEM
jgi:hypothetical protein